VAPVREDVLTLRSLASARRVNLDSQNKESLAAVGEPSVSFDLQHPSRHFFGTPLTPHNPLFIRRYSL
jgi:hypothetical protein